MDDVDPAQGVVLLAVPVVVAVIDGDPQGELIEEIGVQQLRIGGVDSLFKGGKGGLLDIELQRIQPFEPPQVLQPLLRQRALGVVEHQIFHGLGKDLRHIDALAGVVIDISVQKMAELMGKAKDVRVVPVGVEKDEGRAVIAEIGLEGLARLVLAQAHVEQLVVIHEAEGLLDLAAHGLRPAAQDLDELRFLQPGVIHRPVVELLIERDDALTDLAQIARRLLRRIVAREAVFVGHILVAVIAQDGGELLPGFDELDVEPAHLGIILTVVGHQRLPVSLLVRLGQIAVEIDLPPVAERHARARRQLAVLRQQGALAVHQREALVVVDGQGGVGVLAGEALPEIVPLQPFRHGRAAAEIVHVLHHVLQVVVCVEAPGQLLGVVRVAHVAAGADLGQTIHGVEMVVVLIAAVEQARHRAEGGAALKGLLQPHKIAPDIVERGLRPFVDHIVKMRDLIEQAVYDIAEQAGQRHGGAAAEQRGAQQQRQKQPELFLHLSPFLFLILILMTI